MLSYKCYALLTWCINVILITRQTAVDQRSRIAILEASNAHVQWLSSNHLHLNMINNP